MADNVYWLLKVKVHEESIEDFKALAKEMTESAKKEEGCLASEWSMGENGRTAHGYERYRDSSAALRHLNNFVTQFAERFQHFIELEGFDVYGADAELRSAVASFQPAYYERFEGFTR